MNERPVSSEEANVRWTLVRDIAVFQAKLIVDGLRDLVLVPASLVAGIISLLSGEDGQPGTQFYRLLGVGKQSERWINLFGALRNAPPDLEQPVPFPDADLDDIVGKILEASSKVYCRWHCNGPLHCRRKSVWHDLSFHFLLNFCLIILLGLLIQFHFVNEFPC